MGCTHHTLYLIYLPTKLASIKNLINFAENILILYYMGFMYYAKSNTLWLLWGCAPQTPFFKDTIPGLAPSLSKS